MTSGFTLYETLRILIPGGLAAAILGAILHILRLTGDHRGVEVIANNVTGSATFFVLALVLGFILYALDFPARTRLSREGDPAQGFKLPTTVLGDILKDTAGARRSFSLYFLLSDAYMPAESHRRIYFFGGVYRIFADARILLAAGLVLGVHAAMVMNGAPPLTEQRPSVASFWYVVIAAALLVATGGLGELGHAQRSIAKARREASYKSTSQPQRPIRDYASRIGRGLMKVLWPTVIIAGASSLSIMLQQEGAAQTVTAWILATFALALWLMLEIGPPSEASRTHLRDSVLRRIGLSPWERTQYLPVQRLVFDLSLLVPVLIGATAARSSEASLLVIGSSWFALAFLCVFIMAVRKHEIRLLANYKDQVNWLEMNRCKIKRLGKMDQFGSHKWI